MAHHIEEKAPQKDQAEETIELTTAELEDINGGSVPLEYIVLMAKEEDTRSR